MNGELLINIYSKFYSVICILFLSIFIPKGILLSNNDLFLLKMNFILYSFRYKITCGLFYSKTFFFSEKWQDVCCKIWNFLKIFFCYSKLYLQIYSIDMKFILHKVKQKDMKNTNFYVLQCIFYHICFTVFLFFFIWLFTTYIMCRIDTNKSYPYHWILNLKMNFILNFFFIKIYSKNSQKFSFKGR